MIPQTTVFNHIRNFTTLYIAATQYTSNMVAVTVVK